MYAQPSLPLTRPFPVRLRGLRGPFVPSPPPGPYRLPPPILERLTGLLAPFRNRDAALALAVMLARYWTAPGRLDRAFPVDRRALAGHAAHDGLTEARVRGALATLELIGFLDRTPAPAGSRYKPTADGLHRKPVLWQFGGEFATAFRTANARAQAARGARPGSRRPIPTLEPSRPSTAILETSRLRSPKGTASPETGLIMGDRERGFASGSLAPPPEAGSALADALARLGAAVLHSGANPKGGER